MCSVILSTMKLLPNYILHCELVNQFEGIRNDHRQTQKVTSIKRLQCSPAAHACLHAVQVGFVVSCLRTLSVKLIFSQGEKETTLCSLIENETESN